MTFIIFFVIGFIAGVVLFLIMYALRPRQKRNWHHFNEDYETNYPKADTHITDNTRRDKSIDSFK